MSETIEKRGRGRPRKTESQKADGAYANVMMGVGTNRDRSAYTGITRASILMQQDVESLYLGDGFARKVIDVPSEDMVRAGFEIENETLENDDELFRPVMAKLQEINALNKLSDAVKDNWIYGGAVLVMGINDGGTLTDPLNFETVSDIEFLRVYDRYQVSRNKLYEDPADKRYKETEIYMISPSIGGTPYLVHQSRVLVFDGEYCPARVRSTLDGWGISKLQHCQEQLQRLNMSHNWAEKLLERAQQAVHTIEGLGDMLRAPGGEALVRQRIDLVDMTRGINNTVVIDGAETYTIESPTIGIGVTDMLDRFGTALCAVTGMPESILFGKRQGGLAANDQQSLENWYAQVAKWQKDILMKPLDKLIKLAMKITGVDGGDYVIEFCPLWMPSDKEKAETEKLEAEAKKIEAETANVYVQAGALDPSELRNTLREEGNYLMDGTNINAGEGDGEA